MAEVFHIAPTHVRAGLLAIPMAVLVIVIGVTFAVILASVRGASGSIFTLTPQGLQLSGDLYGRLIPLTSLRPAEAARVDIRSGPLRPTMRTLGTALPGYRSGWFRLANGSKALLYVTDPARVVHIPTSEGYSVLLSVAETDRFVERMHALAGDGR